LLWLTGNRAANPDEDDEIFQIEWAKSSARAARATEEVLLLREEMRRVIEFLRWKSEWWISRAEHWPADTALAEGLRAYAINQSMLQRSLSQRFQTIWKAPLQELNKDPSELMGGINDKNGGDESDDSEDEDLGDSTAAEGPDDDNIYV
jgi:hypothetical protein